MILAHLTTNDTSSAALTFGVVFLYLAWARRRRGQRQQALRFLAGGVAGVAIGLISGMVH